MLSALRLAVSHRSAGNRQGQGVDVRSVRRTFGDRIPHVATALIVGGIAALAISLPQVAVAAVRPAANPNPHTSTYVGTAGTTVVNVNTDTCAGCHRAHTAQNALLLPTNGAQSDLCFTCHDGTGASSDVQTEFASAPQNDPTTASYFRHDATAVNSGHTLSSNNEFGGVLNRHSVCTDCHNPHSTADVNAATPVDGVAWPISGRLSNVAFVSVDNTTTPITYTFSSSGPASTPAYEYQVCFKCHSNFTVLPTNTSGKPSQDMLDAAAEFNPANASYHPIEAAGKNTTLAMGLSLSGTSTYKLWTFTASQTVRCTNCHADPLFTAGSPTANADLPSHTSSFRGILVQNYQDRVLNARGAAYNGANYALCYTCHTDKPFANGTTANNNLGNAATNFIVGNSNLHRYHMSQISGSGGGGLSIDVPGDGQGNALCAECHFRPHSTKFPTGGQASNSRLVNFAPDVTGNNFAAPVWNVNTSTNTVSCDLTCHGKQHNAADMTYTWVP